MCVHAVRQGEFPVTPPFFLVGSPTSQTHPDYQSMWLSHTKSATTQIISMLFLFTNFPVADIYCFFLTHTKIIVVLFLCKVFMCLPVEEYAGWYAACAFYKAEMNTQEEKDGPWGCAVYSGERRSKQLSQTLKAWVQAPLPPLTFPETQFPPLQDGNNKPLSRGVCVKWGDRSLCAPWDCSFEIVKRQQELQSQLSQCQLQVVT